MIIGLVVSVVQHHNTIACGTWVRMREKEDKILRQIWMNLIKEMYQTTVYFQSDGGSGSRL